MCALHSQATDESAAELSEVRDGDETFDDRRSGPERNPPSVASGALHHSREVLRELLGPPDARNFDVRYWDGTRERAGVRPAHYTLSVNRPGALRRMLMPPSELSIAEAYLSGDIDVDGELEAAVSLPDAINASIRAPRVLARIVRHLIALPANESTPDVRELRSEKTVRPAGRQHEPSRDRAAIHYHYDVGNDFYSLWLDERMVYSCGFFRSPSATLDEAQVAKIDLVCRKLRLQPGDKLLDVGCGWGALIMHAVQRYGVTALGITLSEAQAALARAKIAAAGIADRCVVELRDYRDLPTAAFDKISSVGMVEHVGVERLPIYFGALYRALVPKGLLLNHGIVSVESARRRGLRAWLERRLWRRDAFIDQYVFPDGKLGPLHKVIEAAEGAGFETRDVESLREHYAMTLRSWVDRLTRQADRAVALTNERTFRVWRLYMTASAVSFTNGSINVVQTLLSKPDAAGRSNLPLTRDDILALPRV
ncbi:MAG TPA: cyclopropane-fatty-acyl-phospholipid synthase family protein [Gemmatimonadaceae bacterium]